jgi:hypothetical protein
MRQKIFRVIGVKNVIKVRIATVTPARVTGEEAISALP